MPNWFYKVEVGGLANNNDFYVTESIKVVIEIIQWSLTPKKWKGCMAL